MKFFSFIGLFICIFSLSAQSPKFYFHQDTPFVQDYAVKYHLTDDNIKVKKVCSDRNSSVRIMTNLGILQPVHGRFLFPGTLKPDRQYLPMRDMSITAMDTFAGQFIYLTRDAVLSNSWAGEFYRLHKLPGANILCMGKDFECLISDGHSIEFHGKISSYNDVIALPYDLKDIRYSALKNQYYLLTEGGIYLFNPENAQVEIFVKRDDVTALAIDRDTMVLGTKEGYERINLKNGKAIGSKISKLPCTHITCISKIHGRWWFGSPEGAFALRADGKYDFYNGERWLTDNAVLDISSGPDRSILILSQAGLSYIYFPNITLEEKAQYFEQQVRLRHVRHGFNATLSDMEKGDLTKGTLKDSDNDGLWTSLYLASQAFRYRVTKSEEALQNCRESLDAMERLYTINPVPGFPSRSFERHGYQPRLADPDRWQHAPDPRWDWKATTSSDEAIGHMFVFAVIGELVDQSDLQNQAIRLMDTLMSHILNNELYLVDFDGKPTTWGRWHPDYVNNFSIVVGDRKLNSSNIISMLQTAYHFTEKEKYKSKANELLYDYGYLENLMRPIKMIGSAPEGSDDWSQMLSESWNHSDDEMYYCGYWGLYRYAFNDDLKQKYREAILDHWEAERPEKESLWNIFTAITGVTDIDLPEAVWYLQQYPVDLIDWSIENSKRKDIQFLSENFRNQLISEVLPPDERPVQRHNSNMFNLDRLGRNGTSEFSAGDIWLLPYWMARYLGLISPAKTSNTNSLLKW